MSSVRAHRDEGRDFERSEGEIGLCIDDPLGGRFGHIAVGANQRIGKTAKTLDEVVGGICCARQLFRCVITEVIVMPMQGAEQIVVLVQARQFSLRPMAARTSPGSACFEKTTNAPERFSLQTLLKIPEKPCICFCRVNQTPAVHVTPTILKLDAVVFLARRFHARITANADAKANPGYRTW